MRITWNSSCRYEAATVPSSQRSEHRNANDATHAQGLTTSQVTFAFTLIYLWTLAALKLSQLCFYYRAFGVQLKLWIYAAGAIVVMWAIIFSFVFIFLCDPVEQQWTIDRIGHCMDQILVLKCIIMTNVLTDIMIIILPISTVWALQMRKTEKFAILSCFALGIA